MLTFCGENTHYPYLIRMQRSFDQNIQYCQYYWESFTRWPFHFSWIKIKTMRLGKKKTWYFPNVLVYPGVKYVDAIVFQHPLQPFLELEDGSFLCSYCAKTYNNWIIEEKPREKPQSPKFNLPFDKNCDKKFVTPQRMFVAKKWGYRWELGGVFGSIIPLALPIDPWKFHVDVLIGKKSVLRKTNSHLGQNPLYT